MNYSLKIILTALVTLMAALPFTKAETDASAPFVFDKKLGSFESSISKSAIATLNMKIANPSSFPGSTFVDIKQIKTYFIPGSLENDTLIIEKLILDINKLALTTNDEGDNNLQQFLQTFYKTTQEESLSFMIQELVIILRTVEVADYSKSRKGKHNTYDAGIRIDLTDVSDIKDIIDPLQKKLLGIDMKPAADVFALALNTYDDIDIIDALIEGDIDNLFEDFEEKGKASLAETKATLEQSKASIEHTIDSNVEKFENTADKIVDDSVGKVNEMVDENTEKISQQVDEGIEEVDKTVGGFVDKGVEGTNKVIGKGVDTTTNLIRGVFSPFRKKDKEEE